MPLQATAKAKNSSTLRPSGRHFSDGLPTNSATDPKIHELRFSADYHKALVVFAVPDKTNNATDVVLEDDGFGRYRGSVSDPERMEEGFKAKPHDLGAVLRDSYRKPIIVTLPNTRGPAFRHEPEFRRQLTESVPVKGWGYKIQEIRLSGDSHKVLVLCLEPGAAKSLAFTLEDDGFRRFIGRVTPYDAENKEQWNSTVIVTVTLPDK